jgi:hypothetical protein
VKDSIIGFVLFTVVVLAVTFLAVIFCAKMESDAYNRITGGNTTWSDAIFLELRVMDTPSKP